MPKFTMQTDLTSEEERLLTTQLLAALNEQEKIKREAAESAAEYRTDLKGLEKRIHELKVTLESGRGQVEIDVDERPGANGVFDLFRKGTDEKVGERPMRDADRQTEIPGAGGAPVDLADEQDAASTPAEAEAMRAKRLEAEHAAQVAEWVAQARENVVVTAQDGGGFLAALLVVEGGDEKEVREIGETEDEARDKVLAIYAESLPKFEPPAPTWDEVQAAGAAEDAAEVAAIEDEVRADAEDAAGTDAVIEAMVAEEAAEPAADGPKVPLLKAPKGKRAKRIRVVDEAGAEIAEEPPAPAPETTIEADVSFVMEQPLCTDDCAEPAPHEHTEERTAF